MKIAEKTTKDIGYYINPADETAGHKRIDSNFEMSTVGKMLPDSIAYYREIIHERKSCSKLHCHVILRNCHGHLSLQQSPP